jgi:arylsulfatase A
MLTRRGFLAASTAAAVAQSPEARPNILLFLTDDLGAGDIGPYGVSDIQTPNLDRLARQGVRFTNSYSNAPVCTPTRCGLMTGRYQQRYGLEWALTPPMRHLGLSPSVPTLPRILKNAGYRTSIFGKWHLGGTLPNMPIAHGFDYFYGITGGNVDFYSHENVEKYHDLWENEEPIREEGYLTELITRRTVKYLDEHSKSHRDQPFFVYVPYNAVHWPFQAPRRPNDIRNRETWFDGTRADYKEMVESVDQSVGAILGALDRNKLANTLVIFTNDNGGERLSRNTPFFHHKATLWEGGIRVPTLMRWTGKLPANKDCDQPMISMDLTATALKAAGAPMPDNLEGIDLMPFASGKQPMIERTLYWRIDRAGRKQQAVRRGNIKWINDGGIEMVFDLERDPGERNNIFTRLPEKAMELRKAYGEWEADIEKNPPPFTVK